MTTDSRPAADEADWLTRAAAADLITMARTAAADDGIGVAVAVVDAGGHLVAFERTDDTPFLAGDVAIDKAWTAASFGVPTHVWNDYISDPHVTPLAYRPRVTPVAGGYPLTIDNRLVGGIGVSGGTYDQDQRIAEAALTQHDRTSSTE